MSPSQAYDASNVHGNVKFCMTQHGPLPVTRRMVDCPICSKPVKEVNINRHIDSRCESYVESSSALGQLGASSQRPSSVVSFFQTPTTRRSDIVDDQNGSSSISPASTAPPHDTKPLPKRSFQETSHDLDGTNGTDGAAPAKRSKGPNAFQQAAPLAERMRPRDLDEVCGQELVGPNGVLRGLIEQDRVPSMILWGGAGTGKTTIARVIASMVGSRFVEINSTSSGVGECKKLFAEARGELGLTGRKTIIFCVSKIVPELGRLWLIFPQDEIHRFSKSQQDVFLGPVESGLITLIGATTENPSFKVQNALLSRCRTFTLQPLKDEDVIAILRRALEREGPTYSPSALVDSELISYLAAFADGDARTGLNLLELAMGLSNRGGMTKEDLKKSLTKTLVYDRAGDQHYDTISAFHKAVRGSDPDAALYYLARMLQSGEDALYIARRIVVIASEDIGLADNSMLPLATAAYTAAEKIGMPEARINLAHATVAMALSKKSTRAYRGLNNAYAALGEPGVASLPVPVHLRNAPTKLMKELGYGKEYKYSPDYKDGKVSQEASGRWLHSRTFAANDDHSTCPVL